MYYGRIRGKGRGEAKIFAKRFSRPFRRISAKLHQRAFCRKPKKGLVMKADKKTRDVITDRKKWLHAWLRNRSYDIGAKRRDYVFIYYATLCAIHTHELARQIVINTNERFTEPLDTDVVNSIIRTVNAAGGYKLTNQTIIDTLGITQTEVEKLRIGHNLKEKAARAQRQLDRITQSDQLTELYNEGKTITELATMFPLVSKSTIERIVQPLAREKKRERNRTIWQLADTGLTVSAIAKQTDCSEPTVRRVLNGTKPSNMTTTEDLRSQSDAPRFVDPVGMELFLQYKAEVEQATPEDYDHALSELQTTGRNVRIVGTGGTGKTQLIRNYLAWLPPSERSSTLVVAPTGLAASHIGGETVHKAFGLSNEVQAKEAPQHIPRSLQKLQRVIIDEISMLRIDLFEQIVTLLQSIEAQQQRHIQLIVLGDFGQLEPVCTKEDRKLLRQLYPKAKGIYAFHSELWDKLNFQPIVLKHNFRQEDLELSQQLTALKYGSIDAAEWFNDNCNFCTDDRAVYICPKNEEVEKYNRLALERFEEYEITVFKAKHKELAPNTELPCPKVLHLAEGMRIMTIANDRQYKNGSLGTILKVSRNSIRVLFDNCAVVTIRRKKFTLPEGSVYEQLPVVLAYAFTVHKCQGCTFDSVVIVPGFFAAGQLYTALSRCKTLEGICIDGHITKEDVIIDTEALKMTL